MQALVRNLFDFESPATVGERIFHRCLEGFIVAFTVKFCWEWGVYIQQIELVLLPLGVARYVDVSFMFENGVSLLVAAAVTVLCGLGLLRLWRYAYLVALLLFHLQYAARYCLGEISHGSNLVGMSLLMLALAAVCFRDPLHQRRFTMGGLYFFVGLGYTLAAVCKLVGTGLHWPAGAHLWLWIAERQVDTLSKFGAFDPNWLQELILQDVRLGTVVLGFGLLVEACGFLIWWRSLRPFVLLGLIGMHLGVAVSMNILFDVYIYELLLLALPWTAWLDGLAARVGLRERRLWKGRVRVA